MLSYTATPHAKYNNYIFIDLSDTLMGFCLFHVSLNVNVKLSIIRPHHNTTYVDAAYCYRPSSVVCRSACRSVCHTSEPCKNGWTDRDADLVEESGEPMEPCITWESRSPMGSGNFEGERGVPL